MHPYFTQENFKGTRFLHKTLKNPTNLLQTVFFLKPKIEVDRESPIYKYTQNIFSMISSIKIKGTGNTTTLQNIEFSF